MKELTYEELEALEKAGFPLKRSLVAITKDYSDVADIIPPTTDELIEELGESFGRLLKIGNRFIAYEPLNKQTIPVLEYKDTTKSALCALYVALHKITLHKK